MNDIRYSKIRDRVMIWGDYSLDFGSKTFIMGILNITPDSFSDGGNFTKLNLAIRHAEEMINQGADIIDVGGESTRPGAEIVSTDIEISRVIPFIKDYKSKFSIPLSLDTSKSSVGLAGLESGADMINDVWGFQKDPELAKVSAAFNVPVILMHNQIGTSYEGDIVDSMKFFFNKSVEIAIKSGVDIDKIIIDPGIGFGKTQEANREVLARLGEFSSLGFPLLLGTSRKSIIGTILNLPAKDRLEGTLATSTMGIISGVDILRVHDVKENRRVALVTDKIVRI